MVSVDEERANRQQNEKKKLLTRNRHLLNVPQQSISAIATGENQVTLNLSRIFQGHPGRSRKRPPDNGVLSGQAR
jgi:hypothetical protein